MQRLMCACLTSSHAGFGITEAGWNTGVQHLVATLDRFKVPRKEKGDCWPPRAGSRRTLSKSEDMIRAS